MGPALIGPTHPAVDSVENQIGHLDLDLDHFNIFGNVIYTLP
jgi:hypothetical protein